MVLYGNEEGRRNNLRPLVLTVEGLRALLTEEARPPRREEFLRLLMIYSPKAVIARGDKILFKVSLQAVLNIELSNILHGLL